MPAAPTVPRLGEYPVPFPPGADYNKQSIAVPGTERPGHSGMCAAALCWLYALPGIWLTTSLSHLSYPAIYRHCEPTASFYVALC